MRISTKGRYGLRAMLDLAINSHGDHVPLKSIAERQDVSESYMEQVFSALRKAGLVKSVKGPQGGYILAVNPSNITIGDILRVLEGTLSVVDENNEEAARNNDVERCLTEKVWNLINESINGIVDSITLEDLMQEYKKMNNNKAIMYYI
ncbi:MAG: RrF2 family transcriptional regulator [Bacillota bacterium]